MLLHSFRLSTGAFLLLVGFLDSRKESVMVGLMTGLAFSEEAGNGMVFALIPHIHPMNNGKPMPHRD